MARPGKVFVMAHMTVHILACGDIEADLFDEAGGVVSLVDLSGVDAAIIKAATDNLELVEVVETPYDEIVEVRFYA